MISGAIKASPIKLCTVIVLLKVYQNTERNFRKYYPWRHNDVITKLNGKIRTSAKPNKLCIIQKVMMRAFRKYNFYWNLTLSMKGGGGIRPLRFFLHNSKMQGDIRKKLSDFNFTSLTVILRILSITIVVRCYHSDLLFPVCHIIFWVEKQKNMNYFQDNYLIKLKFGIEGYFNALNSNSWKI